MRAMTPQHLADHNIVYREPALYDELMADATVVDEILAVIDHTGHHPTSVLDLGCGTGRVLADLHTRRGWPATGIDLQPDLLDHARTTHPELTVHPADLRTARLHATFDLLVCVGNTLSYLHTEPELAAAFTTMAAHARPGALLTIATLHTPPRNSRTTTRIHTRALGDADIETTTRPDTTTDLVTTTRTWRFHNGPTAHDTITRRIWPAPTLHRHATRAGFTGPITDPTGALTLSANYAPA